MDRRSFIATAGATAALGAGTARAQGQPQVRWRMPSSFPKSLDTVWGNGQMICDRVRRITDGRFEIQPFSAGEIVPPLQVLDAVQNGTTECGHTAGFYYLGKETALVFDTGVPFGMTPRQHNAWMYHGGGLALMRDVYAKFNVVQIPCGNTGAQMGGWFRREITKVEDFQGLRIRTPGFLGMVYSKLGAVPQQIAGGDIYPALEKGTLDAVEWVGPYDDEKLGFGKIAKFYYGPGVMELGASLAFIVNKSAWDALPQPFKDALQAACAEAGMDMLAKYDANNIAALKRLVASGVSLRQWPQPVMRAMQQATNAVLDENAASNPTFKRVYDPWRAFRNDQQLWYSVNDGAAEQFLYANREKS